MGYQKVQGAASVVAVLVVAAVAEEAASAADPAEGIVEMAIATREMPGSSPPTPVSALPPVGSSRFVPNYRNPLIHKLG